MSAVIVIVATVALMLLLNALFVAAEFATVSARKSRIRQLAASENRLALMLLPIVEESKTLDKYIAACQLGITASSLVLGAYGQNTVATALEPMLVSLGRLAQPAARSLSATGVLLFLTLLQVVLGELFPKSVAIQYPERVALAAVIPVKWSLALLRPFIWFFNGSGNLLLRLVGVGQRESHAHVHSPEEIELLVAESHRGGLLDAGERQLLRNAFRLRELTARQVMTPRIRLFAAPAESTIADLIALAAESAFTRIPIYRGTIDNVIGFVHIKDLFRLYAQGQDNLAEILREVIHVPENLAITDLWARLSTRREYLAIVLGEFGGTAGLITIEDLVEEIFGELQDEFDDEMALISSDREGRLHLRGNLLVTDVNEFLSLKLPEDQADTLGGLVMSELGRIPATGNEVAIGKPGVAIRVEAMDALGVSEVSLQLPDGAAPRIVEWETA